MSVVRSQAEALAIAVDVGAVDIADVVAWADEVIAREERPHWSICEIATTSWRHPRDLVTSLRDVPGRAEAVVVADELAQLLARGLATDASRANQMASVLFQLAAVGEVPHESLESIAWWAWDALDLADQGMIAESREEIVRQMRVALDAAASACAARRQGRVRDAASDAANLVSAGHVPVLRVTDWYERLEGRARRAALSALLFITCQASPTRGELDAAAAAHGLAGAVVAREHEASVTTLLERLCETPNDDDARRAFRLMLNLFVAADGRRRATRCASGCTHAWHAAPTPQHIAAVDAALADDAY